MLSRFKPDPFSLGSKSVVTDESVTKDEIDQDETTGQDLNLEQFSQRVANIKSSVNFTTINCSNLIWRIDFATGDILSSNIQMLD